MQQVQKPIVRVAPSPTGTLHLGTARTALFNYLFAKNTGGAFIVRIEDTDRERSTKEFEDNIMEGLAWLGLSHDSFFRQSERGEIYEKYLNQLLESGAAYVSEEKRNDTGEMGSVIRFKNPNKEVVFKDVVRGEISFDTTELGDFVIAKSVSEPLYHVAVVSDDIEMGVTHVIRGEDHISNTPRQILIQEALGVPQPTYVHLPLILGPDKAKLSKRHGAKALAEYRNEGILPDAMNNFMALLGWHPGADEEVFSKEELIHLFSLERIQKSSAMFNEQKLRWINGQHLKKLSDKQFLTQLMAYLPDGLTTASYWDENRLHDILPILRERVEVFDDVTNMFEEGELTYFFIHPEPKASQLVWKNDEPAKTAQYLQEVIAILKDADITDSESAQQALMPYAEQEGKGSVLWPVRYALSGLDKSPDPFTLISILGREESIARLGHAVDILIARHEV